MKQQREVITICDICEKPIKSVHLFAMIALKNQIILRMMHRCTAASVCLKLTKESRITLMTPGWSTVTPVLATQAAARYYLTGTKNFHYSTVTNPQ